MMGNPDISRTQLRAVGDSQMDGGRAGMDLPAFAVKTIDQKARQIRVLASSTALDRYNERIVPEAFRDSISAFMMNPCVLAAHAHRLDDGQPPVVGSVVKIWIDAKGLWAIIQFAETELAETYWQLYSHSHMRAVSVGFLPLKYEDGEEEGRRVRIYTEVELLEISLVAIPANPEALVRSGGEGNSFVARKKQEREDHKLMVEVETDFPDAACREFAEALLCDEYGAEDDSGEMSVRKGEFVNLVRGGSGCGFANLVK